MYPDSAISLKQILQSPNFLRKARDLPQRPHRLCLRTANFGLRLLFSIRALRAIRQYLGFVRTNADWEVPSP